MPVIFIIILKGSTMAGTTNKPTQPSASHVMPTPTPLSPTDAGAGMLDSVLLKLTVGAGVSMLRYALSGLALCIIPSS